MHQGAHVDLTTVIFPVALLLAGVTVMFGARVRSVAAVVSTRVPKPFDRRAHDQRALVEAVATWAENLRDTMSASSGLEQAIISTEHHAPRAIARHVQRLVASLRYGRLDDGLRRFADDIGHPTCDFVVAALVAASQHQTRDVTLLLGHLAECARAECDLYLRIWVSRARSRAAVRIISVAVAVFSCGLVVLNPTYLSPFLSVSGLVTFMFVALCFTGALVWLGNMAKVRTPARFLSGRSVVQAS
jgi:tight adherence protein B